MNINTILESKIDFNTKLSIKKDYCMLISLKQINEEYDYKSGELYVIIDIIDDIYLIYPKSNFKYTLTKHLPIKVPKKELDKYFNVKDNSDEKEWFKFDLLLHNIINLKSKLSLHNSHIKLINDNLINNISHIYCFHDSESEDKIKVSVYFNKEIECFNKIKININPSIASERVLGFQLIKDGLFEFNEELSQNFEIEFFVNSKQKFIKTIYNM